MGTRDYLIVASDVQREEIPNDIMSVGRSSSRGITSLRSCQKLVHSGFPPLLLYATRAAHWAQSSKKMDASTNTLTPIHDAPDWSTVVSEFEEREAGRLC